MMHLEQYNNESLTIYHNSTLSTQNISSQEYWKFILWGWSETWRTKMINCRARSNPGEMIWKPWDTFFTISYPEAAYLGKVSRSKTAAKDMWSSAGSRSRRTSLNLAKIFLGSLEFISDIARIYALANARITITSKVSLGGVSKDTIGKKTTNLIGADTGPKSLCTLNIALQWFKAQSKSRWFFYFFFQSHFEKKHLFVCFLRHLSRKKSKSCWTSKLNLQNFDEDWAKVFRHPWWQVNTKSRRQEPTLFTRTRVQNPRARFQPLQRAKHLQIRVQNLMEKQSCLRNKSILAALTLR